MKARVLNTLTVAELIERFAAICVEQNGALFQDDVSKFNCRYDQMDAVREELKSRPGDQRRALLTLFDHPDMQVRLQAARSTLAIAPKEARQVIEAIASSRRYPQAGDAGMTLMNLDRGIFVPK